MIQPLNSKDKQTFLNFIKYCNNEHYLSTVAKKDIAFEFHFGSLIKNPFCPNYCKFCIVDGVTQYTYPYISRQDFKEGWELYKKLGDYKPSKQLSFIHGDYLAHPYIYDFLEQIRNDGYSIQCCNNMLLLKEDKIDFMKSIDLHIIFTTHTYNKAKREILYRNSDYTWDKVNLITKELNKNIMGVSVLYLGDDDETFKDIEYIHKTYHHMNPDWPGIFLGPLEHSIYSRPEIKEMSLYAYSKYQNFVDKLKKFSTDIKVHYTPIRFDTEEDLKEGEASFCEGIFPNEYVDVENILSGLRGKVLFCSSERAYKYWKQRLKKYKNIEIINIINYSCGGSFGAAAFLHISDINIAINNKTADHLLLPRAMFSWEVIKETKPIKDINFIGEIHIV